MKGTQPNLELPAHRLPLAEVPTRVERLEEASRATGASVWVKRDDETSRVYGGNKVRKLEFLLAEARRRCATGIWTTGPWGSHHVLAAALFARSLGLECRALLFPQYPSAHACAVHRAILESGCRVRVARSWPGYVGLLLREGPGPGEYRLPAGSSCGLGCLGYVLAGLELAEQVRCGPCPRPDVIVLPLGSGGTAAGLLVGLAAAGLETELRCVRVTTALVANRWNVLRLAWETVWAWRRLAPEDPVPTGPPYGKVRLRVAGDQFGGVYGRPTAAGLWAAALAQRDGLDLETTYTAKAYAHLLECARPGETWLFWNTYAGGLRGKRG